MQSLSEIWNEFRAVLESFDRRLLAEWEVAWRILQGLLAGQKPGWDEALLWNRPFGTLRSLHELFQRDAGLLLDQPLSAFRTERVQERALDAIGAYRRELDELARALPESVQTNGREVAAVLGPPAGMAWIRKVWFQWNWKLHELPLQDLVRRSLHRHWMERRGGDGAFFALLAQDALDLSAAWRALSREALRRLSGLRADTRPVRRAGVRWLRRSTRFSERAEEVFRKIRLENERAPGRLAALILEAAGRPPAEDGSEAAQLQQHLESWALLARGVADELQLDSALAKAACVATEQALHSLESLEEEHRRLSDELESVIRWLEAWPHGGQPRPLPERQADLVPARERVELWLGAVRAHVQTFVPESVEILDPASPSRDRPGSGRQVPVRAMLLKALGDPARRAAYDAFRPAENVHREIVDEIERARKVIEFGQETAAKEGIANPQLAQEAISNALSLLVQRRQITPDVRPTVENGLCHAIATAFCECQVNLEWRREGLWGHLSRHGLRDTARLCGQLIRDAIRKPWVRVRDSMVPAYHAWVVRRPQESPWPRRQRVAVRTPEDVLPAPRLAQAPPGLYRRLFDLGPVEDPRFLTGREIEMAALARAKRLWEQGRPASVIVVGEPGSGKTSLLNCAVSRIFSETEVLRAEFRTRTCRPAEMQRFLGALFQRTEGRKVTPEALTRQRKVVILEGLERAFLREPGGYDGLRDLLSLIALTSRDILWLTTANDACYALLESALDLGRYFPFRVDAAAVGRKDVEDAILLRHRLSGQRLHITTPERGAQPGSRLLRVLTPPPGPQQQLFDAVHQRSEGVFRVAFQAWLASIERMEGGFVYIHPPASVEAVAEVSGLASDYLFTLQALLQHGGLSIEEHAILFHLAEETSRAWLEALEATGAVEADPELGFRVAAHATVEVRRALRRRNLIIAG